VNGNLTLFVEIMAVCSETIHSAELFDVKLGGAKINH
jgi:hypothetical protein